MRILYAAPLPLDDIRLIGTGKRELKGNHEHFLFSLFSYIREEGNNVIIITASRMIRRVEEYNLDRLKILIVPLWTHGRISAVDSFRTDTGRIARVIKNEKADVYHAQWCYEYAMACLMVSPEKTIITMHDWPDAVCPAIGNYYWKKKNVLGNSVISQAKRVIAVSPYIGDRILSKNSQAEIELIPNYFCEDEIDLFKDTSQESDEIRVICVNNGFDDRKNTSTAMKAFSMLKEEISNCRLDMYGDDYEQDGKAEKWAKENLKSIEGIHFHGRVRRAEIAKAFSEARILLHTSKEESFGLIYLEAMASGTDIIAGNDSGATPWVLGETMQNSMVNVMNINEVYLKLREKIEFDRKDILKKEQFLNLNERFMQKNVLKMYDGLYSKQKS